LSDEVARFNANCHRIIGSEKLDCALKFSIENIGREQNKIRERLDCLTKMRFSLGSRSVYGLNAHVSNVIVSLNIKKLS